MPSIRYAFVRCSSTVSSITNRVCAIWRWSAGAPRARTLAAPRASGGVHSGQLEPRWALAAGAEVAPAAFGQRRGAALLRQLQRQPQGTPASRPGADRPVPLPGRPGRTHAPAGPATPRPPTRPPEQPEAFVAAEHSARSTERAGERARSPEGPRRRQAVARQPHRSLVVAELGKRSGRVGAVLGLDGRSRSVRRPATHRGPDRGSSTATHRRFGSRSRATDHDLYRRHHRHVLHAHFTAGRPAPDRWLGQHPADIVLDPRRRLRARTRRDPLLHGLGASRRALRHKTCQRRCRSSESSAAATASSSSPAKTTGMAPAAQPFHDPSGRGRRRRHARDRR
jgi:hypothetical protein